MAFSTTRDLRTAALIAALSLTGCEEAAGPTDDPVPETGAVSVTVSSQGMPLGDAIVRLYIPGNPMPLATSLTSPNGSTSFGTLLPGNYEVGVTPPVGYSGGGKADVQVAAGEASRVLFTLQAAGPISPYGSIQVRVFGDGGAPVAGIFVELIRSSTGETLRATETDSNGSAMFADIAVGFYEVKPLLGDEWTIAPGDASLKPAYSVEDGRYVVDFALRRRT